MAMRNRLDKYWKLAEVAPLGIALQVAVTNAAGDLYVLPFPCMRISVIVSGDFTRW